MRALVAFSLLVLSVIAVQQSSRKLEQRPAEYFLPRHVSGPLGGDWINWSPDMRTQYIRGYYEGYQRGDHIGCGDIIAFFSDKELPANIAMPEEPAQKCLEVMLRWSNPDELYAEKITQYYETYRTDYNIPVPMMMEKLSEQKHMTLEQIHHWFLTGNEEQKP